MQTNLTLWNRIVPTVGGATFLLTVSDQVGRPGLNMEVYNLWTWIVVYYTIYAMTQRCLAFLTTQWNPSTADINSWDSPLRAWISEASGVFSVGVAMRTQRYEGAF